MWTGCGCRSMTTGSGRVGVDSVRAGSRPSSPQPRLCNDVPIMMAVRTLNSIDCVRVRSSTHVCWYRGELSNKYRTVSEHASPGPPIIPCRDSTHGLSRFSAAHNRRGQQMQTCVCGRTWPSGWGRESGRVAANSTACSSSKIMSVSPGPRPGPGSGV